MELWVRSQDKTNLYKIDNINIDDNDYSLYYQLSWGQVELGAYKTKERALQVLDEIQRILHPTVFMSAAINTDDNNWVENGIIYQKYKDNFNIQELSTYVYQMPEE